MDTNHINGKLKTANPFTGALIAAGAVLAAASLEFLFYLIPIVGFILLFANVVAFFVLPILTFCIPAFRKYYTGLCPKCDNRVRFLAIMKAANCSKCKSRVFFVEEKGFQTT